MFIKSIRNKLDVVQSKQVGIILLPESKQAVTHRWCGGWSNPVPADQNVRLTAVETQQSWALSSVGGNKAEGTYAAVQWRQVEVVAHE